MRCGNGSWSRFSLRRCPSPDEIGAPSPISTGTLTNNNHCPAATPDVRLVELALKAELQLTDEIIDSAPGIFYLLDDTGNFLRWNKNLETVSGYDGASISRLGPLGLFAPDTKPLVSQAIAETFSTGQACLDAPLVTRDGKVVPYYFTGHCIKLNGKRCLIGFGIDMSDQKQSAAELEHHRNDLQAMVEERTRQLQHSEARMRTITDALPSMVSQWDKTGRCRFANRAYQEWFGQTSSQMQGQTIRQVLGESLFQRNLPHIEAAIRGQHQQFERTLTKPSGEIGHLLVDYIPERVGEEVIGFYVMVTDVTLVKRAEAKLEKSQQLLRQLLVRQDQIRESERKHLARELHDELGQLLTGMHFMVSALQLSSNGSSSQANQTAQELESYLDQTQAVVRRITHDLHPTQLEHGLLPALEALATEFSSRSGVTCRLTLSGADPQLNGSDATSIFRIAQESLTNVARHARAQSVSLHIESTETHLKLKIRDNGQGFDSASLRARGLSFGLLGMQERAALLGATLQIDSVPGSGTRIEIAMEIEREITP